LVVIDAVVAGVALPVFGFLRFLKAVDDALLDRELAARRLRALLAEARDPPPDEYPPCEYGEL
jgi:hypothetical protein